MTTKIVEPTHWVLYIDGASRNNPGPSGAGIYLLKDGQPVSQEGFFLGTKTNNQAEYLALLLGLYFIKQYAHPHDIIRIASDSQLLVRQLLGAYRIKNAHLFPLYSAAKKILEPFTVDIFHVMREDNAQADRLANKGIDSKKPGPVGFFEFLQKYEISFTL